MRVEGSLQCPYYVAPAVAAMLGTDLEHLHVRAFPMGGAFGGKEDFPSLLGGHAALLSFLSKKPVRIAFDRAEDIAYTTKRHPSWIRIKAGARKDGCLCGVEIEIVFDGGAYATMSPVVLSRGAIHASGAYNWPNAKIEAVAYRTNTPPNGAFRGFGVPQTIFAIESHMDRLAKACGMEPHSFREKNRLKIGDKTATSQVLKESVGSEQVLQKALESSNFEEKYRSWGQGKDRVARGIGLGFFWHGAGFTGSGEAKIAGRVALDLSSDGLAHIRVSSTEMGQGSHTVLPQIVAEELSVLAGNVICDPVDTRYVPDSGPTVASRTTMIVGGELAVCARNARKHFLEAVGKIFEKDIDELEIKNGNVLVAGKEFGTFSDLLKQTLGQLGQERWVFESQHKLAPNIKWDEATHTGDAYAAYAWGCMVVEVVVDLELYEISIPKVTVAMDVGRAVNPIKSRGQIQGGVVQSLGYALCEEVGVRSDGAFLRDRFQTYIVPTASDSPPIDVHLIEVPYSRGPGGAKGLGEMPIHGGAPALANAIEHALGIRICDLPITPEKIFMAMKERIG
ncbi:MAG: molybdopterin cofactor-binding domain-containing protein, partial [Pseudomonadota bacterium]